MSKILIIAEKPSVAQDLSRALGKLPEVGRFQKEKDYFESEHVVISSSLGHLVELCMPNAQTGARLKWNFEHLPILPDHFELQPIEDTKSRLKLLVKLMKRKDVSEIVNACDAGREGELIFRYLVEAAGVEKPMCRMWMQSMTTKAITEAYQNLRRDEELLPLADAARCRSESDWLIGINGTRALTAFNSRYGGFSKTPVGRVKTPTLAIMVHRENEILAFEPRDYFEIHADFAVAAGVYPGRWFDEKWKKNAEDEHDRAERVWSEEEAQAIVDRCRGKEGEIEQKIKPSKQAPPSLYDLTSLQREASNRFGFSARRTLQLAQSLYERHKALTYPRTDSRYLPGDYVGVVKGALGDIQSAQGGPLPEGAPRFAGKALDQNWVRPNPRIFDDRKVSDHFAIIPTGQIPKRLDEAEMKLYGMVVQRFIAIFYPAAEFEITTRITRIGGDAFKTEGKVLKVPGWREVYGKSAGGKDDELVPITPGEGASTVEIRPESKTTKPPPRFTEATILSAMEGAGKLVDDEELREAMAERGLGTPATRAAILEGLISDKYVVRNEKELVPTPSARKLIDVLERIGIDILYSPEMTGQWEQKLKRMEHGELPRDAFMRDIRDLTVDVVERAKTSAQAAKQTVYEPLDIPCPLCDNRPLKQDEGSYRCTAPDCKFSVWKTIASREMTEKEITTLLRDRHLPKMSGFRSRLGKDFDAALELDDAGKVKFVTEKSQEKEREIEEAQRSDNVMMDCPVCEGKIHETGAAYVCDRNGSGDCKARLPKEMCKHAITRAEAEAFFKEGKSPLIETFISKKGRPFKAHLILNQNGRRFVDWEFPPRPPSAKKSAKKKGAQKKPASAS